MIFKLYIIELSVIGKKNWNGSSDNWPRNFDSYYIYTGSSGLYNLFLYVFHLCLSHKYSYACSHVCTWHYHKHIQCNINIMFVFFLLYSITVYTCSVSKYTINLIHISWPCLLYHWKNSSIFLVELQTQHIFHFSIFLFFISTPWYLYNAFFIHHLGENEILIFCWKKSSSYETGISTEPINLELLSVHSHA